MRGLRAPLLLALFLLTLPGRAVAAGGTYPSAGGTTIVANTCPVDQVANGISAAGVLSCTAAGVGVVTSITGTVDQVTVGGTAAVPVLSLPNPIVRNLTGNVTGNVTGSAGSTTGNAATATALAADGANCSAGQFPLGVDASGAAQTCTALPTTIVGTANQIAASAATGTVTLSIPTSPTLPGTTTGTFSGALTGNASTATALAADGANCSAGSFPLGVDASGAAQSCTVATTGTVTSVAQTVPQEHAISGSPVTTTGTLAITRAAVNAIGNLGASPTINWNSGVTQSGTLNANATVAFSNPVSGQLYQLILLQDATGARTVTWPAAVVWPDGTALTVNPTASTRTLVTLWYDGTNYQAWLDGGTLRAVSLTLNSGTTGSVAIGDGTNVTTVIASTGMNYSLDAAGTDTYVGTISPAIAAYVTGAQYVLKVATANTGAATVNLNGLGAKSIVKVIGGVTTALVTGDILADQIVYLAYDGTNMQMQSVLASTVTATSTTTLTNKTLSGNTATNLISGSGTLTLNTSGTVTAPNATDTLVAKATTDTLTNKTIDAEGTGNVVSLPFRIFLPAAGCDNVTAGTLWDLPTSTPAVATCVTGSNIQKGVLAYADTSGGFSAQITLALPADWTTTGGVDVSLYWTTTATSGNAKWSVSTACTLVDATATDDPTFNTANTVTTAAPGTASRVQTSTIAGMTMTGCTTATAALLHLKVFRDGADAADTIAATANLIGLMLTLRRAI